MYDTNWIDGVFDGGHFSSSEYTIPNFVDTIFQAGSVGLTFSTPHGLVVGDLITIDKTDGNTYLFKSEIFHEVTPITNGERWSLIMFLHYDHISEKPKKTLL
jgi:hypothetical protein